ncbi:MAG: class I SAM-dependent methyltransferase [Planctomycetota bacterium]|jgi:SAM-dependent methyltransferase
MRVVSIPGSGESFDLDRPGAVAAWNRALNRRFAMENLRRHPNPLVRRIEARRRARIASLVPRFDRAVDLGAEDGSLAATWRDRGRFVLLLDLDASMLRRARTTAVAADAAVLPLDTGSFDVVVCSALLEHVVDPAATVAEIARVLRPGGRLVAYVPWDAAVIRLKRWIRRLRLPFGPLHDGPAPGHLRVLDRARLRQLFAPLGDVRVRLDPLSLGYYVEATA